MTDKPWSTRIPAMIAKAEEKLGIGNWVALEHKPMVEITSILTAGELALAKEAAKRWEDDCEWCQAHREPRFGCHAPPPALITFTEKMEGL